MAIVIVIIGGRYTATCITIIMNVTPTDGCAAFFACVHSFVFLLCWLFAFLTVYLLGSHLGFEYSLQELTGVIQCSS